MQDIVLVGAGGCMRELVWQIQELNKRVPTWNILGYVECVPPENGEGVYIGGRLIQYLGTDDVLLNSTQTVYIAICVGSSYLRKKIAEKYRKNSNIRFPNLILSNTYICEDVEMGQGCIISMDVKISTNVKLGDFVFLNTGSMICHDGTIGDYVTLSPNVTLAGAVFIGNKTELGMGAKVIQGVSIGKNVVIGAGSVVIKDTEDNCTAVGVPSKVIR